MREVAPYIFTVMFFTYNGEFILRGQNDWKGKTTIKWKKI